MKLRSDLVSVEGDFDLERNSRTIAWIGFVRGESVSVPQQDGGKGI